MEKAKAFLHRAEEFLSSIEQVKDTAEASFLINSEYDILHALASAIQACDGEKFVNVKDHHKELVGWVAQRYQAKILPPQAHIFDELRKTRNDINYYGQKDKAVLQDFYGRNKDRIAELRDTLLTIIQEKLAV